MTGGGKTLEGAKGGGCFPLLSVGKGADLAEEADTNVDMGLCWALSRKLGLDETLGIGEEEVLGSKMASVVSLRLRGSGGWVESTGV